MQRSARMFILLTVDVVLPSGEQHELFCDPAVKFPTRDAV